MAIAYYGAQISPHMDLTPEGFLICRDVPINRIGEQIYLAEELGLEGDPGREVAVYRRPDDVFSPAALASFEAKDVTAGHPPESVTPENHALYAKGHVQNVRRNGDFTVADLVVKDASLISDIRNGVVREISCGYLCSYVPEGDGYRQTNIQGNHVAVVLKGRAGSEVSIKDSARCAGKGRKYMGKFGQAILEALGMAAHEAEDPQEVQALVAAAASALDAAPDAPQGEPPAAREAGDVMDGRAPEGDDLGSKLDRVLALLEGLGKEERAPRSEADLDETLKKLTGEGGGEAVVIPADAAKDAGLAAGAQDAAVVILRTMRPIVAAIEDEAVRSQVADAVLSAVQDPGKLSAIHDAAADSARKAADQSAGTTYEQRCAESQAAYADRNPHKRREKEA